MATIAVGGGGAAALKIEKVYTMSAFLTVAAFVSGVVFLNWRFKILTKRLEAKMSNR